MNGGLEGNAGIVSVTVIIQLTIDIITVLGVSGVIITGTNIGEAALAVSMTTPFPSCSGTFSNTFSHYDKSLYDEGCESERDQIKYDSITLNDN